MNKFTKILLLVWACLAILSFLNAFWAPLYFKIIGLTFGGLNMITILTWVITYLQGIYYQNKIEREIKNVQMQTHSTEQ